MMFCKVVWTSVTKRGWSYQTVIVHSKHMQIVLQPSFANLQYDIISWNTNFTVEDLPSQHRSLI